MGAGLIAWTARGAVACWAARWILRPGPRDGVPSRADVVLSACGWLLLAAHTVCAFHLQHKWSHAEAYAHTARRTADLVGWEWGGGLFINYATIAVWGVDVVVLARSMLRKMSPPRWWTIFAAAWLGFVIINATLVFGPRWWWWGAAGAAVILTAMSRQLRLR